MIRKYADLVRIPGQDQKRLLSGGVQVCSSFKMTLRAVFFEGIEMAIAKKIKAHLIVTMRALEVLLSLHRITVMATVMTPVMVYLVLSVQCSLTTF